MRTFLAFFSGVRKITAALAVLTPCLLFAVEAHAATTQKPRARTHRTAVRRTVTPNQAFARLAARRPDRRVRRHVSYVVRRAHTQTHSTREDVAIQNDASAVGV